MQRNDTLCQSREKTDWAGQWIWADAAPEARNVYALFRRPFVLEASAEITVAITADSFYELFVDGCRLGHGPARAHLNFYSFDRYTLKLDAGEHVLAAAVHHIGVQNATVMTGRPGLLVDVCGEGMAFGSDASWRCRLTDAWRSDLPCLMSHFGFWEECELPRLPATWTAVAFDDSAWRAAVAIGKPPCAPWLRLMEPDIPPPRRTDVPVAAVCGSGTWAPGVVAEDDAAKRGVVAGGWLKDAPTVTIPSKHVAARIRMPATTAASLPFACVATAPAQGGSWLTADFGRTVSGYPVVTVEAAEAGATVDLAYDDVLRPDASVDPERTYARMCDRFVLSAGRTALRPFHPRGFRYMTIDVAGGGAVQICAIRAEDETYPFPAPAAFACSDAALASYQWRGAETVRICSTDAFTDCASRERVQWMEDLYLHGRVAAYAFGDTLLLRRALFQGAQNALPDGRINGFMPSERTGCAFASSSLVWLHALADYRLFAGDAAGCHQLLPTARKLVAFLATQTDGDGLIRSWPAGQFWDWSPIEGQGCLLLTNAFYLWALRRLRADALLADALGEDGGTPVERISAAAHLRFWDEARGLYRDAPEHAGKTPIFSQHANALAVLAEICPAEKRVPVLRRLIDPANLGPVPVGEHALTDANRPDPRQVVPVGTLWFGHFLCQALFEAGLDREALAQMRLLWGACGEVPTFPETRRAGRNTTQCHGWASGPAWLLPAYVLGARPVGCGWSQVVVAPQPGGLAQASGTVPTPYGPLRIGWRQQAAGGIDLQIDPPAGVSVVHHKESVQ